MLSKLSGLFSSLQGNMPPAGLPTNGFPGQLSGHDHAAGGGLPGQDPNVAMLNDMMQVSGLRLTYPEFPSHLPCVVVFFGPSANYFSQDTSWQSLLFYDSLSLSVV